MSDVASLAKLV